ncbi:class I SAM-dependent methyltransferase [Oxalicibacterium solurbis]|uniref:SAM-dependent methyltransferase n=1 Tax=Oxalicibacterium solurbis TaxID=69280 RepID=A0A8J3AX77_9BURK|nr:class I SAM-dependent methyltransferase [Oxalicibacterium solurbis]GGI53196.1 SAM-dependent methyltransferase [Oxalicibacterium solurbis]
MSDPGKKPDLHEATGKPSPWVARFVSLIPEGETLDLACGGGRHSRLLAASGHSVLAVDRKVEMLALTAGDGIRTLEVDLETGDLAQSWPFAANRFAGIVVTNYLHRPLWQSMIASLQDGGVLIYETFAQGNGQFGKPSNPDFLLANGELLDVTRQYGLRVVAYEDGYVAEPRPAMLQRICAVKPGSAAKAQDFALI